MNGFKTVSDYSKIKELEGLNAIIYCFLLSQVTVKDEKITSVYSLSDVREIFCEEDWPDTLNFLLSNDYIVMNEGSVYLGEEKDGRKILYSCMDLKVSIDFEKSMLENMLADYSSECTKRSRKPVSAIREAEYLLDRDIHSYTSGDFARLYCFVYEVAFQEYYRPLLGKERGQINTLYKLYSAPILFKIITHFIVNSEKFCRGSAPSLGLLLFHKDTIYTKVTEKKSFERISEKSTGLTFK